jgi:hypothetical protein
VIPTGSTHPDAQYAFDGLDAAIRDAAAWRLVDVECEGRDHRAQRW